MGALVVCVQDLCKKFATHSGKPQQTPSEALFRPHHNARISASANTVEVTGFSRAAKEKVLRAYPIQVKNNSFFHDQKVGAQGKREREIHIGLSVAG